MGGAVTTGGVPVVIGGGSGVAMSVKKKINIVPHSQLPLPFSQKQKDGIQQHCLSKLHQHPENGDRCADQGHNVHSQ